MELYFDNCATTRVCQQAVEACVRAMTEDYGNPSSLHKKGMEAEDILKETRRLVAGMLGGEPDGVYFTGCATESNNIALLGTAAAFPRGGKTIVTTSVEHASVDSTCDALEAQGYTIRRAAPGPDGNFCPRDLIDAVDSDTLLLSMMAVNNEIGTMLPLAEVIPVLKKRFPKLIVHVDAVQGFAKYPLNVKKLGIDLLSFSGHKLYAPKGIGVLYVRKGLRIRPVMYGGGQEKGLRSGTQAVELIAALAEALKMCRENQRAFYEHYQQLNRHLREGLAAMEGIEINSPENGAPHLLNFSVLGIPSEIMLHFLESKGISVSSGSACAKGAKSSVLGACGLPDERIRSALRVSFSKDNTIEDADVLLAALAEGQKHLLRVVRAHL